MTDIVKVVPDDEYNQAMVANVHPSDWINPTPAGRYNLVVIGAGTAGLVAAAGAAGLGARVALVEKHLMGGDCLAYGCVPSKCLIRSSRAAYDVNTAYRFGISVPSVVTVDFPAVMERMRRLRAEISHHDSASRFRDLGVDIFLGEGRFSGSDTVDVAGQTIRFKKAVVATGARAFELPVPGLPEAGFLTNETVFGLTKLPSRLAVVGGGPLGCELAQAFRRFGSEVTVIEKAPHILAREDQDAARIIEEAFKREGISILTGIEVEKVEKTAAGKIVYLSADDNGQTIAVDEILVAVGRVPNVDGLDLEKVGVEYDKRGVTVDDTLRSTNPRIFAAGDICSSFKFTHTADAQARILLENALFPSPFKKKSSMLTIPWCTYTDPEIAHVGMYESDAHDRGIPVKTFSVAMNDVDRAIADGETEGLVKIHVRAGSGEIIGATMVARHAGEMISEVTMAMKGKVGLGSISGVIHPYPTQAEAIRKVADSFNRTRLTPIVKKLFNRWFSWTR
ncbi:MAG: mercuric reductase [bacterium]|jgi:pyruvate/2-oxoglutarate dehydrogenase complex dihydrolipoamide dehydrogenase (E3) component|nr:mercuric reductase [bacterium]